MGVFEELLNSNINISKNEIFISLLNEFDELCNDFKKAISFCGKNEFSIYSIVCIFKELVEINKNSGLFAENLIFPPQLVLHIFGFFQQSRIEDFQRFKQLNNHLEDFIFKSIEINQLHQFQFIDEVFSGSNIDIPSIDRNELTEIVANKMSYCGSEVKVISHSSIDEAKMACSPMHLHHEGIRQVFGMIEENCIVENCESTLQEEFDCLDVSTTFKVFLQIAQVLKYCHEKNIGNFKLSMNNVYMRKDGSIALDDFLLKSKDLDFDAPFIEMDNYDPNNYTNTQLNDIRAFTLLFFNVVTGMYFHACDLTQPNDINKRLFESLPGTKILSCFSEKKCFSFSDIVDYFTVITRVFDEIDDEKIDVLIQDQEEIEVCKDANIVQFAHGLIEDGFEDSNSNEHLDFTLGVHNVDDDGRNRLHKATLAENCGEIRVAFILGVDIDSTDNFGQTSLLLACDLSNFTICELLLNYGADPNIASLNGWTPLHAAVDSENLEIVDFLIKRNDDVNVCDEEGYSPLHLACLYGLTEIVRYLLNKGANVEQRNQCGKTPLILASEQNFLGIIGVLISYGGNIDAMDDFGNSPLTIAVKTQNEELFLFLFNKGVNLDILIGNESLEAYCMNNGLSKILESQKGSNRNVLISERSSICLNDVILPFIETKPIGFVIENVPILVPDIDVVITAIQSGANINAIDKNGLSLVYKIVCSECTELLDIFLKYGVNLSVLGPNGESLVQCSLNNLKILEMLLVNGAEVNTYDRYGNSPLYLACLNDQIETVKTLLTYGADVDLGSNELRPIFAVCLQGSVDILDTLLLKDVNLNVKTPILLETPFILSCKNGKFDIVEKLILGAKKSEKHGIINMLNINGESSLLFAVKQQNLELLQLLLANGAGESIDKISTSGENCLSLAIRQGSEKIVQLLLYYGASLFVEDKIVQLDMIDIAKETNNQNIIKFFENPCCCQLL
eukprot:TRINITY_DN1579_c0_g1_i1.p1 TRINITY_DN1579_c0_g1~~TRINITY_DN1579_c0_g1_i1.p1  ORF type:complete len:984 (-),score=271.56 TRINITY_DN1579_c0_g1_i1:41-2923(-)